MLACVRHGQTSWNERRLLQGSRDIGLDDRGVAQAVAAGRILGATDWAWIRASPLERARRTAGIIAQHVGQLDVHIDAALIERDYGAVEGMPASRAAELFPDGEYPESESVAVLRTRSARAIRLLLELPGAGIAVSHGAFLRAAVAEITGEPCPRILNGQVVLLEVAPGGRVSAEFLEA